MFVQILKDHAAKPVRRHLLRSIRLMDHCPIPPPQTKETQLWLQHGVGESTLVSSAAGADGTLAGWAISSIEKNVFSSLCFSLPHITLPACAHRYASCDYACRNATSAEPDKTYNYQPVVSAARTVVASLMACSWEA